MARGQPGDRLLYDGKNMETITKAKIAGMLKQKVGFSGVLCEEIVSQIFSSLLELAQHEGKLIIRNFGGFRVNNKKARPGLNLKTKERVTIPPKKVLSFIPSTQFKSMLNSHEAKKE